MANDNTLKLIFNQTKLLKIKVMKTLIVIISTMLFLTLNSNGQNKTMTKFLENKETRQELFNTIQNDHELMMDFMQKMKGNQHAMMMINNNNNMMMGHEGQMGMNNNQMMDQTQMMNMMHNNPSMMEMMMSNMVNVCATDSIMSRKVINMMSQHPQMRSMMMQQMNQNGTMGTEMMHSTH